MTNEAKSSKDIPRLYHAASSYYSMIARLALIEGGIFYESVFLDILFRMQQQHPNYVRMNAQMTVPTLIMHDRVLDQSREIAEYAFGTNASVLDDETKKWVDLHYSYPIEELTFGGILARNPLARVMIPKRLEAARKHLLRYAEENPDLAGIYKARAEIFAQRVQIFSPRSVVALSKKRQKEAFAFMDQLEHALSDNRAVLVPPLYGISDVVWTIFLARIEFIGLGAEISRRPALLRYWHNMQARPSFSSADIWTKIHPLRLFVGILGFTQS